MQDSSALAPHPYCDGCGLVRYVGSRRAMDLGGLANLLARLEIHLRRNGRKVTEAQRRLITRELATYSIDDTFALSRAGQLQIVAEVAARRLGLPTEVLASYLRSC